MWHVLHPRGVHAASPSPLDSPCGTFITLEVSVPQLHHAMGSLQHLHHPGDVSAVSPIALGGSLQHLHHPGGAHAASPPSYGDSCSFSITLEVPLPNLHHAGGGGGVYVLSPPPLWCPHSMSPSPLGVPAPLLMLGLQVTSPAPTMLGGFPSCLSPTQL